MANLPEVNTENFKDEVLDENKPVLVDFNAEWCGPCKMLDPVIEALAGNEWAETVKVVSLDADKSPDIVMQYGVMGIPTLLLFKDGEVAERMTGFKPKPQIIAKFGPHLN